MGKYEFSIAAIEGNLSCIKCTEWGNFLYFFTHIERIPCFHTSNHFLALLSCCCKRYRNICTSTSTLLDRVILSPLSISVNYGFDRIFYICLCDIFFYDTTLYERSRHIWRHRWIAPLHQPFPVPFTTVQPKGHPDRDGQLGHFAAGGHQNHVGLLRLDHIGGQLGVQNVSISCES